MTTIVSIASVRWLAVVEFSLGIIKSVCVHHVWTSHKLQFIFEVTFNLLASMSAVSFGLAILFWVALSYTVIRISCIKGTLLRKSLHDNFAFHSQVVGGFLVDSSAEINWQFWLQLCRSNEVVLSVIDEPRKSFAQESHHPVAFDHFLLVVRTVLRCNANRAFALVSHFMSFNLTGFCSIAIWLSVSYLQPKQILT